METIGQRQLRNDNAEIMRRVEAGESFVVTRNGRPIADLVPHARPGEQPKRRLTAGELQIAATAAAARIPLLTANPKDFAGLERLVDVVAVGRPG